MAKVRVYHAVNVDDMIKDFDFFENKIVIKNLKNDSKGIWTGF